MQSSAAVVLRALVMLACLVGIPLAALFGSSLPKLITTVLDGRLPVCLSSASATPSEPAQFEPTAPGGVIPAALAEQTLSARPMELSRDAANRTPQLPEAVAGPVAPAVYEAPMGSPMRPGGAERLAGAVRFSNPAVISPTPNSAVPAQKDAQNDSTWPRPSQSPSEAPTAAQPPSAQDQFTLIQDRLRKLGATYYLLESWGSQQDLFRFYCKMAIGGNPNYTRHFEATHCEPIRAMAAVLQQVEAWQARRE